MEILESLGNLLAGTAFFLVGLKLFGASLNQITSHRFQAIITHFTPNELVASLWGVIISILTAGNTVLTPVVSGGLRSVDAIDLRKAFQIVNWSRVGSCFYVYLAAGFDIKAAVLVMMGLSGICFGIDKPKKWRSLFVSIFYLCLVLFGIQLIKSSTKVLVHYEWFETLVNYTREYPLIAFGTGGVFLLISQSLFGGMVIAISMIESGVFDLNQAVLFAIGLYLGEVILKFFYLPLFKSYFKMMISILPLFYAIATVVGIVGYTLFRLNPDPFLSSNWLTSISPIILFAHVNFVVHIVTTLLISFNVGPLITKMKNALDLNGEKRLIERVNIPKEVLDDINMTTTLLHKENLKLIKHFPDYMDYLRKYKTCSKADKLHHDINENLIKVRTVFSELLSRHNFDDKISEDLLKRIERNTLFMSLEENLYDLSKSIVKLKISVKDEKVQKTLRGFIEAIDAVILSLIDVYEDPKDHFSQTVLLSITDEREDLLRGIRHEMESKLSAAEKLEMMNLTNLFESTIWVIKKLSISLQELEGSENDR